MEKTKKKERASKLEERWRLMHECIEYLEKNEPWLIASRLERQHDQNKRLKMWEQEASKIKPQKLRLKDETAKEIFWNNWSGSECKKIRDAITSKIVFKEDLAILS
jgi:hypothetical protein